MSQHRFRVAGRRRSGLGEGVSIVADYRENSRLRKQPEAVIGSASPRACELNPCKWHSKRVVAVGATL